MPKSRRNTVLALFALGIGGLIALFVAHYLYILASATPLHPDAQHVPSSTRLTPSPKWTAAVEQGRQLVRTGIFEQKAFSESIPFKLAFKMRRNPDMTKNGRFPTAD